MGSASDSDSIPLTPQHATDDLPDSGWKTTFRQGALLGRGGCAEVFLATHLATGEEVALKISNQTGEDRRRFVREVRVLRQHEHHHIMPIRQSGEDWYAMPVAEDNLTALAPILGPEERIRVARHAALGLGFIHNAGLVHRDVSPNNILRMDESDGRWVVSDFGFVRNPVGQSSVPNTNAALGTNGFRAPEVLIYGSHHATAQSDIYSLGRTLMHITTGKSLQDGVAVPVPLGWSKLVESMTQVSAAARLKSMDQVLAGLDEVETALRTERRVAWEQSRTAPSGLLPQERRVLGWILQVTNDWFRTSNIFDNPPQELKVVINIGLIGLERRGFIEPDYDERGDQRGHRLTNAARDWVIANANSLVPDEEPEPEPTPPPPPPPADDSDAPF